MDIPSAPEAMICTCGHALHYHLIDPDTGELACAQVVCTCNSFVPADAR